MARRVLEVAREAKGCWREFDWMQVAESKEVALVKRGMIGRAEAETDWW